MNNVVRILACGVLLLSLCSPAFAAVKLPSVFGSNMVLQQGRPVPVWGWADKGEQVTVTLGMQKQTVRTGDDGRWKVTFAKLSLGKPLEMTVKGVSGNSLTLTNVLVGEVWVCSGQSNMEIGIGACNDAQKEIAAANYPEIRIFRVPGAKANQPASDVNATWVACSPQSIGAGGWGGFSAAAYYFGREIHKELKVPVGLIGTYFGGSAAEEWVSRQTLEADPLLKSYTSAGNACDLYNGQLFPLIPFGMRGVIWYQGESNIPQAHKYRTLFPALIKSWRAEWGQGDFPFGFVQIAPFRYEGIFGQGCSPKFAELCEAQLMTLKAVPNTGMAVTMDIGNVGDIHPQNKQDVGRRLALWAMAKVYGKQKLVYSGPIYKAMKVEGKKIKLRFDQCGTGLIAKDGKPLTEFTIAGADQNFHPAQAVINGNTVVVSCDAVMAPVAVRYAWQQAPQANLANKEGLPASSFRTDSWKGVTEK